MNNIDNIKIMIARGNREDAIKQLVSLVKQNSNDIEAWLLLGESVDDPSRQKDCYNQVLRISPDNPIALVRLRDLELSQLRLALTTSDKLHDTQPKIQSKPNFKPSQSSALGERVKLSGNQPKLESMSSTEEVPVKPSKTSFGTYIVLGIVGLCILSLLGQCISGSRNSTTPHIVTADPQEQAAITAVQNQDTILANNMHDSIAVVLVLLENEGHTQSIDGWYVNRVDGYYSVKFYFYLDGNHEYAEWWYYPDTELVMPKNDWAFAFMGE